MSKYARVFKTAKGAKFRKGGFGSEATPEDHTVRKVVSTREGSVEKVPVENSDIVNKLALDTAVGGISIAHAATTGQTVDDHHNEDHAARHAVLGADPVTITHLQTTGQGTDDHHAKSHIHNGLDGSGVVAHAATTGQGVDDHHDQLHSMSHTTGGDIIKLQEFTWDANLTFTGTNPPIIYGGADANDDIKIQANSNQSYPFIKLNGNGNIAYEVATGDEHNFKINGTSKFSMSGSGFENSHGDYRTTALIDPRFILSDAAGARVFRIMDSGLNGQWWCDSDGNVNGVGEWNTTGDINSTGGSINAGADVTAVGDIYTAQWANYGSTSTVTGFSLLPLPPVVNIWYKKVGNMVFIEFALDGTSNATGTTFTLPYTTVNSFGSSTGTAIQLMDNGVLSATPGMCVIPINSNTVTVYTDWAATGWTATNRKAFNGQFFYEAQ